MTKPTEVQPVAAPENPVEKPAPEVQPVAAPEPPKIPDYSEQINERNAGYMARNPEAWDDMKARVEEKLGPSDENQQIQELKTRIIRSELARKFSLDDADLPLLSGNDEAAMTTQAKRIAELKTAAAAAKPATETDKTEEFSPPVYPDDMSQEDKVWAATAEALKTQL